jgi:hypothetical protein
MLNTYYSRELKSWVAYYADSVGQLGDCEYAATEKHAAFLLGLEMGRNPQAFTRQVGE